MPRENGAMYTLVHEKTNAINAIKQMTEALISTLEKIEKGDDEELEVALSVLQKRKPKMDEVDSLDRRIAFLEESGYTPDAEEQRRIELDKSTTGILLNTISRLDQTVAEKALAIRDNLMDAMKDIKDSQKSIQAYAGPLEEEEGRQVDTKR